MWKLPFSALMADKVLLDARGYAMEQDMYHARNLDPDMLTIKNDYAIDSEEMCVLSSVQLAMHQAQCSTVLGIVDAALRLGNASAT